MTTAQIVGLVVAATAFLTAATHLLGDILGWIDRFRKLPIQQAAQTGPPAPPAPPTAAPGRPPAA